MKSAKIKEPPREKLGFKGTIKQLRADMMLYIILLPTLLYFFIFRLWPIIGMRLAFYTYKA
ncbi:MAG: sugar ABC transporter permease, partial [Pseudomonadota bacterium]